MNKILLIGGTDPTGAGLQTDWQITYYLQVQASSVVTAVTSQNSHGVFDQGILPFNRIKSQLDALKEESFSVIKIGMLGNKTVIEAVLEFIEKQPSETKIILDPVITSSSGGELLTKQGINTLLVDLLPYVTLITPNTDELEALTSSSLNNYSDIEKAAQTLLTAGAKAVLVKGGHFFKEDKLINKSIDLFINESEQFYLKGERWDNRRNVRGTGCSLATSIASTLSKGYSLTDSVVYSKAFISSGIRNAVRVSKQFKLKFKPHAKGNPFELIDYPTLYECTEEFTEINKFASCNTHTLGIYPVVNSVAWLKKLVPLGITTLQLRIKDKQPKEVEDDIIEAIRYGRENNIRLFINDYWSLAVKHQAYGIHLGQEDLDDADISAIAKSGCRLGISTHSYTEVARARAINPSYIALGPIFETTSKIMPWIPQGVPAVESWVKLLGEEYPLVAIGGINLERATALKQTNVGSVAMISTIIHSSNYKQTTKELVDLWSNR